MPSEPNDDRRLAGRGELLGEELRLRGDLEGQEDDLRRASRPCAISDEKSVAFWLTDSRSTLTPFAFSPFCDDVGEAGRVRLLVVDDHDRVALRRRRASTSCTRRRSAPGRRRSGRRGRSSPCRWPSVSETRVAEPEMNARARLLEDRRDRLHLVGAGRTDDADDRRVDANCCATVDAFDGSSCVSPWTIFSLGRMRRRFHCETKNCAQCSWSLPIDAAGPVMGAIMPIETVCGQLPAAFVSVGLRRRRRVGAAAPAACGEGGERHRQHRRYPEPQHADEVPPRVER